MTRTALLRCVGHAEVMAAFDPTVPFRRSDALAAGVSAWRLRAFRRLHRDVYVAPEVGLDARVRALAALAMAPAGALVARHAAALLLGGVVPASPHVHLVLPRGSRVRAAGIEARVGRPRSSARIRGVPVTTAEDTFVDLGAEIGLVDLVVLGDSLVKAARTTPAALVAAAAAATGAQAPVLRRAAALVRAGVDSPMETRLRLLLVLAGLPEPVVNHVEYAEDGRWLRRFDLSYPELKVAVEYDGRQHAESQRQWERDVERREGLDHDGWRLVVVLSKGVYREPALTLDRVVAALAAAGSTAR
ncbi:hypothetical protein BJM39_06100, partial [Salmonella enterica subsp. enterica serovar Javiana]